MFKICLIGCGYMTRDGHGPSCAQYAASHEDTELSACCDIRLEAAQETCKHFGFQRAFEIRNYSITPAAFWAASAAW